MAEMFVKTMDQEEGTERLDGIEFVLKYEGREMQASLTGTPASSRSDLPQTFARELRSLAAALEAVAQAPEQIL